MASDPHATEPEKPKSLIEKLGAALPIGLTAIATVFAGMSTGELQKAMYWKSQAAQDQAKATNQWTLAGFKRDRSLILEASAAQIRAAANYPDNPFSAPPPSQAGQAPEQQAVEWLAGKGPPRAYRRTDKDKAAPAVGLPAIESPELTALLDAIQKRDKEDEVLRLAAKVRMDVINKAIDDAEVASDKITEDEGWGPVVSAARKAVGEKSKGQAANRAAAQAAMFEMEQRRYRGEATLNQEVGFLFEARVKVTSAESDKHRKKSENFFYAMLAAQIGAVVSSLALARKTGSVLWLFAGLAGAAALGYGAVVFLDKLPGS